MTPTDHLPQANSLILPNGLKIIFVQDDSNPVLCLQLYIKTGSVHESDAQRGYSHFIEHLAFKATRDFPHNNISRYASELGGMLNAYTDYDTTCYYLLLPSESLSDGLHILSQLAMHSCFNKADVAKEKDIIIEEIKQYQNEPETDYIEWIQTSYFFHSPLKYPVLGNPKSIKSAKHRVLTQYYHDNYTPDNAMLVVCGDFSPTELTDAISASFSSWQRSSKPATISKDGFEPEAVPFHVNYRKRPNSEDFLSFTMPELCEQHPYADAMLIAMRYFAIGKSSRLYKRMVEEEGLCSSVKVNSLSGMLSGISAILITPLSSGLIPRIIEIFTEEYINLLTNGISEHDLHLVKQDVIHNWLFSFEGMENLANLVAVEEFIGSLERLHNYGDRIERLSMDEIYIALHQYWTPDRLAVYHESAKKLPGLSDYAYRLKNVDIPLMPRIQTPTQARIASPTFPMQQIELPRATSVIETIAENHYLITLSNGMRVQFRHQPQKSISGFSLSTHISQICEDSAQHGHNFFTSSSILYSSELHSHEQLMQYGREHGFNIRVIHHLDSTSFRGKCLSHSLDKALSILAELMLKPKWDKDHFKLLKASTLDSISRDNDYPVSYAYQKWFKLLVGEHSNMYRSTGNPSEIRKLRMQDINSWYAKWSIPRDFSLAIVGCHEVQYVADLCESFFGVNPQSISSLETKPVYTGSPKLSHKQYRHTDQAIIHLGGYACPANNREENAAFHLLSQILGGDISSRFFDIIREKHGFAYQTGFDFSSINELGFWNAYAFCDRKDYKHCLSLMQGIIQDIADIGIAESELDAAKKYLIGMNRFDYESVSYSAATMSNLAALGYEPAYYLNRENRIRAVDTATIQGIAKSYLTSDKQYIHILV